MRELMVSTQLVPRGIRDPRVLEAMRKVPRHLFLSGDMQYRAYDDSALSIGEGQTISQPYMVAVMTEVLALGGDERVLEIGTGSGYQTAILAELGREVFTIEYHPELSTKAEKRLLGLGYENIRCKAGDGTLGWPEEAPFDRILVTAGAPAIPRPLREQLSPGGIIVAPVGDRMSQQLVRAKKTDGDFEEDYSTPCMFVPLMGEFGWEE
jgi:protein-L-isoaspartate(D-aspartate) O-methyltransferase